MNPTLPNIRESCRSHGLFPRKPARVLVACSGGADSVFLLHALWALRGEEKLLLRVVTFDHALRYDSAADAAWVQTLAWSLGLPCHRIALRVPERRQPGESLEMAARRLRHEALRGLAAPGESVALGHHRDDQAETVIMRLCRGTGLRGAGGMAWVTQHDGLRLVRPLLGLSADGIRAQLLRWRRTWREDASNTDPAHDRNRIRHGILPRLRDEVNPASAEHLADFAEELRAVEAHLARECQRRGRKIRSGNLFKLTPWRAAPPIIGDRLLLDYLRDQGGLEDRAALRALAAFLRSKPPGTQTWTYPGLTLVLAPDQLQPATDPQPVHTLPVPENATVRWPPLGRDFRLAFADHVDRKAGRFTAFLSGREGDFVLRSPRPGDQYRPFGMNGSQKLSDLFINAKIPRAQRAKWPVLACGDHIVWVPGFRVSEDWKVGVSEARKRRADLLPDPTTQTKAIPS